MNIDLERLGKANKVTLSGCDNLKCYSVFGEGKNLAAIYADEKLDALKSNPLVCNSDGQVSFYIEDDQPFQIYDSKGKCHFKITDLFFGNVEISKIESCGCSGGGVAYFVTGNEETTMEQNNEWHERRELPPVGTECEVLHNEKWHKTYIIGHDREGYAVFDCSGFGVNYTYNGYDSPPLFRPIQTTKKIDMSKFAGSDVLLEFKNSLDGTDGFFDVGKTATIIQSYVYVEPVYNYWNHWTGSEKPEWLQDGMKFVVKMRAGNGNESWKR